LTGFDGRLYPVGVSPWFFSGYPETSAIRRLLVLAPLSALCACATESASRTEVTELRAELRLMRDAHARLEHRLERVEGEAAVRLARPVSVSSAAVASPQSGARPDAKAEARLSVPELAVVKLRPKADAPPRLDTTTPVVEPSAEVLEELAQEQRRTPSREAGEGEADPAMADSEYAAGLEALRTGNLAGGVQRLQRFSLDYPRHAKADNALYFSGIGLMGEESWSEAAKTFLQVLSQYPAGDAVVDALLKLAECRTHLNQRKEAKALYVQLISQYPGTAAATQAESRLAQLSP